MQPSLPTVPLIRGDKLLAPSTSFVNTFGPTPNFVNASRTSFSKKLNPSKLQRIFMMVVIITCSLAMNVAGQITYTWTGSAGNNLWTAKGNWSPSTAAPGVNDYIIIGTASRYPILTAATSCGRITSMATGTSIGGTGSLTIKTNSTTTTTGIVNISCPLTLNANVTFSTNPGSTLTITGNINGTGSLLKADQGTLNLQPTGTDILPIVQINAGYIYLGGTGVVTVSSSLALVGGVLNIGSGTLNANGGITRTAGFLAGDLTSNLSLGSNSSEALYFASGLEVLNTLTLNHTSSATTTLYSPLIIYNGINFNSSNDNLNLNGQHLTLRSNVNGTAYLGEIKGSLANATNVSVERYMDRNEYGIGSRGWRLLTIPVTGQTIREAWAGVAANGAAPTGESLGYGTLITGHGYANGSLAAAAGFDWFTGLGTNTTASIRYYTPANTWASATNTPNILSAPNKQGYMLYVRGDRTVATPSDSGYATLNPTGTLKQGTQTIAVSDPYTVVGNPYASPIDLDAVYNNSGNSAVINQNFWIWDATLGTTGGYRTLSGDGFGGYSMNGGEDGAAYLTVSSSQAFFVEKKSAGNITINETNKTTATPQTVFRPMGVTSGVSNLSIKLYEATGSTLGLQADGVVARYNNIYNVSPYETYDAPKLYNFNENLSLVRSGRYLSVESRPFPTQNDTLFIPFWGLKTRAYALSVTSNQFMGLNQSARLIDKFTNTSTQIDMDNAVTIYPFSITSDPASTSLNRFTIVMAPVAFGVLPVTFTNINAKIYGNNIQVDWKTASETGLRNYDVEKSADGIHFNKISSVPAMNATLGGHYLVIDDQPFKGNNYYRIRGNDETGKITYSSIAVVQLNGKKGIQVTPSIITNSQFTIALNDQPAGNVSLVLSNLSGQQVYTKTIANNGGNNMQVITLQRAAISTGIYNLTVTGAGGSAQNFRLFIK